MNNPPPVHRQQGAALIVGLIMLLIMTIIGISGMNETVLEEKMIFNFLDRNIAVNSADASLRSAEAWLKKQKLKPAPKLVSDCIAPKTPPLCGEKNNVVWSNGVLGNNWADYTWEDWSKHAVEYRGSGAESSRIGDIYAQPRSVIEFRSFNEISTDTGKGITRNLNADKSSQGVGWHFYNIYGASPGYRKETIAVVQSTFKKWY